MSKEASRIRRVIDRLTNPEDIEQILKWAKVETVIAIFADDGEKFDRSVAIYEAAVEALKIPYVHPVCR